LQTVVVRVLGHPAVDERPRQVVDGVLFVFDCLRYDFGVKVIVKTVIEVALNGERLVQELLEHVLLRRLAEENALGVIIDRGTASSANHLHDISHRVIVVGVILAGVVLRVHDHHQVAVDVEGPAKRARNDDDLDGSALEQRLYNRLVRLGKAFVNVTDALA